VSAIHASAGVDSRISMIRSRITTLSGTSARPSSSSGIELGAPANPTAGFDPFGAAYQAALGQIGSSTPPPADSPAATGSGRIESVSSRVLMSGGAIWTGGGARTVAPSGAGPAPTSGALSGEQIAQMAYRAGFRGDDLVNVVAISKRESSWRPSAFNGNGATGDRSYGLMQINMIGDLGPARLRQFGLTDNEQLLDPQTNLNAAFRLYADSGNSLHAWGGYKGMSDTFGTDLTAARQVVAAAGLEHAA